MKAGLPRPDHRFAGGERLPPRPYDQYRFPYAKYGNLVVVLMLLFNQITFNYTKQGKISIIMKVIAVA